MEAVALVLQGAVHIHVLLRVRVAQEQLQEVLLVAVEGGHQGALTAQLLEGAGGLGAPLGLGDRVDQEAAVALAAGSGTFSDKLLISL